MLPRALRLRSGRAFRRTYEEGATVGERFVVLHAFAPPEGPEERLIGFAVSKKVGNAVVRNLVRRRLREILRALAPRIRRGTHLVVAARPAAAVAAFSELAASVEQGLARASLLEPARCGGEGP